jgi:predicted DNA-binding transcriptional regulator YafY
MSRPVLFLDNGEIFDLVEQEGVAHAQTAFKLSMEGDFPELGQFISSLDIASSSMTHGELEVLALGLALVQASFGQVLSADAQTLGAKVRAVLPHPEMLDPHRGSIGVYHTKFSTAEPETLDVVRRGILARTKLRFDDLSLQLVRSHRHVRPLEVQMWEAVLTLTGWYEDRQDFRVFRLDRMARTRLTEDGFRPERDRPLHDDLRGIKPDGD